MTQTARFHAFSNAEGPTQLNAYPLYPSCGSKHSGMGNKQRDG